MGAKQANYVGNYPAKGRFFFSKSKQQWDGKSKTSSILFFTRGIDGLFAKKIRLVFKVNHWLLFAKKSRNYKGMQDMRKNFCGGGEKVPYELCVATKMTK